MANQNFASFAGSVENLSIDPTLLAGYSTDTSMASEQTVTSFTPPASTPAEEDAEYNPKIGWHRKVNYQTFHRHPTQLWYYVPVPAPTSAPASTLPAPVVPDAQMYDAQQFDAEMYDIHDFTTSDYPNPKGSDQPSTYEEWSAYTDPMVSGYAETYPDTAYPALQNQSPPKAASPPKAVSPQRVLSSRDTPECTPEADVVPTPTRKSKYTAVQLLRKARQNAEYRQKAGATRGFRLSDKSNNPPHRLSVVQTCVCPHATAQPKVKRPRNEFLIFRGETSLPAEIYNMLPDEKARKNYFAGKRMATDVATPIWKDIKEKPRFAHLYKEYKQKAKDELAMHKLLYPNYKYTPKATAALEFGDERCTCGARELNLLKRQERKARATLRVAQGRAAGRKPRAQPLDSDVDDDELSDPRTNLDDEDEVMPTPSAKVPGFGSQRPQRKARSSKRSNLSPRPPPTPPPTASKRPTRGAKASVETSAQKTVVKPSPYKGYVLEVYGDEDEDNEE